MISSKLGKQSIGIIAFLMSIALAGAGLISQVYAQEAIQWYSMTEAQDLAKKNNKKVFIYAEASWCVYCKKMEKKVFPQQAVIDSLMAYYYPVNIDIESEEMMEYNGQQMTQQQFARNYRIRATPTFFFFDKTGKVLGMQPGFIPAETFRILLSYVGSGAFQNMNFEDYLSQHTTKSSK